MTTDSKEMFYLDTAAFIDSVDDLTAMQVGAFMRIILTIQANGGALPNDASVLATAAGVPVWRWSVISPKIMKKLTISGDVVTLDRVRGIV